MVAVRNVVARGAATSDRVYAYGFNSNASMKFEVNGRRFSDES
jgi:hypothetical protein